MLNLNQTLSQKLNKDLYFGALRYIIIFIIILVLIYVIQSNKMKVKDIVTLSLILTLITFGIEFGTRMFMKHKFINEQFDNSIKARYG